MLQFWDWYLRKYTSREDKNSRTESAGKCISRLVFFGRKVNMDNIRYLLQNVGVSKN